MVDATNTRMFAKRYINVYQFLVDGKQFYLCDHDITSSFDNEKQMCILAIGKSFPLGFEITTNDYFINPDCKSVETIGECDIRVEKSNEYERQKSFLIPVLSHCQQFSTYSNPVSFFSFPDNNILGYHVSGRQIASDEADFAVSLLQRFP